MARQRNNIARMPWDLRDLVCEMLFAGTATQTEIQRAVRAKAAELGLDAWTRVKLHGSTFSAYQDGAEYRRYCDMQRDWDKRTTRRRWAAKLMKQGHGPASLADLAEMEILEQLHDLAAGGLLETGKDVATVARAIATLQRTQIAKAKEDHRAQLAQLESEHDAQCAEYEVRIRELDAELAARDERIGNLRALLADNGIDEAGGAGDDFSDAEIRRAKKLYGIDP